MARRQERCIVPLPNGRWRVAVRVRLKGAATRALQETHDTKDAARLALAGMRLKAKAIREGSLPILRAKLSTFNDALAYYLARRSPGRSQCYFDRLRRDLGGVPLGELQERFTSYLVLLHDSMTPAGRNRLLAWANAALNLCVRDGLLTVNPLAHIQRERETPRDMGLSEPDRLRLINAVRTNDRARYLEPLITFASLVPTRRGELSRLSRDAVDLFNGVIRLANGTTKNRDGRYLPIPDECREYFENIPAGCPWAFYRQAGDTYRAVGCFDKAWRAVTAAAGLTGLRFHDLRACAATNLVMAGNDARAVMAVAGWRTDMLKTYYRRDGLNTAKTVRFLHQCDGVVTVSEMRKAENC